MEVDLLNSGSLFIKISSKLGDYPVFYGGKHQHRLKNSVGRQAIRPQRGRRAVDVPVVPANLDERYDHGRGQNPSC